MAWNTVWPEGNKSVKANIPRGVNNMAYINVTMGGQSPIGTVAADTPDHFWARNNYDRHHRFIQMPGFVDGAFAPADPLLDAGQDGVIFNRQVNADVGRWEPFYKNNQGTYQISPCYIKTTVNITSTESSTFLLVAVVPPNVYGEIVAKYADAIVTPQSRYCITAHFISDNSITQAWSIPNLGRIGTTAQVPPLRFLNGSGANNLNIRANAMSSEWIGNWTFYITYRAL